MAIRKPVSPTDQLFLLPPSVSDFVKQDSSVRILSEVIDELDCSVLYERTAGAGAPSYDPRLMLKILAFGFSQGLRSSRKLEDALTYDMRYMYLAQMIRPDYRTIQRFRTGNEKAIEALLVETVQLCESMGLVLLEHVSVDGTKIKADVSGKKTYSCKRLDEAIAETEAAIAKVLEEANECDAQEDLKLKDDSGNDPPPHLRGLEKRRELLRKAKEELAERGTSRVSITDLDSRVMHTEGRNLPAYNAQAVVDSANQVIIAAAVTQEETDRHQLQPMIELAQSNTGASPNMVTADGGYWSPEAGIYVEKSGIDVLIGVRPGKQREGYTYDAENDQFIGPQDDKLPFQLNRVDGGVLYKVYRSKRTKKQIWIAQDGGRLERMRTKIASPEGKAAYRKRQTIVEPVFAHIKGAMNLRRLLLRGLPGATSEYMLACCVHNIQKIMPIWRAQRA